MFLADERVFLDLGAFAFIFVVFPVFKNNIHLLYPRFCKIERFITAPGRASALLRVFESRNRDWDPKIRIFVYNAEALLTPAYFNFLVYIILLQS